MTTRKPDPAKTAREAAEAIRQLNHDTLNAKEMTAPEIHDTVRALVGLVDRLPQTFEQLAGHLSKQHDAGQTRMEDGRDPMEPVASIHMRLSQAAALLEPANRKTYGTPAGPVSAALHDASGQLSNMYTPWSDDE